MSSAGDAFSFAYICSWPQPRILAGSIIVGRRIVLRQGRFLLACAWFLIPDFLNWECDINAILDLVFGAQRNNTELKMMISSTIQLTHTHMNISTTNQESSKINETLHAMEQKRFGNSWMYLPQASQEPPVFDFVDGFASFNWGRGFKCTAFSPLILYVYKIKKKKEKENHRTKTLRSISPTQYSPQKRGIFFLKIGYRSSSRDCKIKIIQ